MEWQTFIGYFIDSARTGKNEQSSKNVRNWGGEAINKRILKTASN